MSIFAERTGADGLRPRPAEAIPASQDRVGAQLPAAAVSAFNAPRSGLIRQVDALLRDTQLLRRASIAAEAPGHHDDSHAGEMLDPGAQQQIEHRRGRGRPLPPAIRRRMSGAFGRDLTDVDIHAGPEAADLARGIGARAFTVGSTIFFGADEYAPSTPRGEHVLSHELAHVVQNERSPEAESDVIHRLTDDQVDSALTDVAGDVPEGLVDALVEFTTEWEQRVPDLWYQRSITASDALSALVMDVEFGSSEPPESVEGWLSALRDRLPADEKSVEEKSEEAEEKASGESGSESKSDSSSESESGYVPAPREPRERPAISKGEQDRLLRQLTGVLQLATADRVAIRRQEPQSVQSGRLRVLMDRHPSDEQVFIDALDRVIARVRDGLAAVRGGRRVVVAELFHAAPAHAFDSIAQTSIETRMDRDSKAFSGAYVSDDPSEYGTLAFGFAGSLLEDRDFHDEPTENPKDGGSGVYGFKDPIAVNRAYVEVNTAFLVALQDSLEGFDADAARALNTDIKIRFIDGQWEVTRVAKGASAAVANDYMLSVMLVKHGFDEAPAERAAAAAKETIAQMNANGVIPDDLLDVNVIAPRKAEVRIWGDEEDRTLDQAQRRFDEMGLALSGGSFMGITEAVLEQSYAALSRGIEPVADGDRDAIAKEVAPRAIRGKDYKGGDCLFRSVLDRDDMDGFDVKTLREMVAREILDNWQDYVEYIPKQGDDIIDDIEAAAEFLGEPGNWDAEHGDLAPAALANSLGRLLIILGPDGTPRGSFGPHDDPDPIFVFYNGVNHYVSGARGQRVG